MITQERLKELLDYDPDTGVFTWKTARGCVVAGSVAGALNTNLYIYIKIDQKLYRAHRLVWLYIHGSLPGAEIDHVNRIRGDNRIANLRAATKSENGQNKPKYRNNTSGIPGVCWHKASQKWIAQIRHLGHSIHIGLYDDLEEAAAARAAAKAKYHTFNPQDNDVSLSKEIPDHRDHDSRDRERV
jgi:hypothetical protein